MRTLIVDDNFHNRETLELMLLKNCPCVEIIGKADSMHSGIELVTQLKPQLLLLDIELGDGTGFELLEKVNHPKMKVIFVTAYDKLLKENLDDNIVGVLMKPLAVRDIQNMAEKIHKLCREEQME